MDYLKGVKLNVSRDELRGIFGDAHDLPPLAAFVAACDERYHNGTGPPLVDDDAYDYLHDMCGGSGAVVGAPPDSGTGTKAPLPLYMGSLDKSKTFDRRRLDNRGAYTVSEKLDGVSALYDLADHRLYTRGNGKIGRDITHLLDHLDCIPGIPGIPGQAVEMPAARAASPCIGPDSKVLVRGELIMPHATFAALPSRGANARNMVAGIVNSTSPDTSLVRCIHFVAYNYVCDGKAVAGQLDKLKTMGFRVPRYVRWDHDASDGELVAELERMRRDGAYVIDGVVLCNDAEDCDVAWGRNPPYAYAFKRFEAVQSVETTVVEVSWKVSKDGLLKPVVHFDRVELGGVGITKATGYNAAFIVANSVGPGAVVRVARCGDVIPNIAQVVSGAAAPQLPSDIGYETVGRELRACGVAGVYAQRLTEMQYFYGKLDVPGIGPKVIQRVFDAGFVTAGTMFRMTTDQFVALPGLRNKANLLADAKERIRRATRTELMVASNVFGAGFGAKRLVTMASVREPTVAELTCIKGVSTVLAERYLDGCSRFREFMAGDLGL